MKIESPQLYNPGARSRSLRCKVTIFGLAMAIGLAFEGGSFAQSEVGELISKEGDLATKWKVNDDDPKSSIPSVTERNKDPLEFAYFLQDLAARAESSFGKANWPAAIKYYEALGHAVPDSWISFNRLCVAYAKEGKFTIAAGNCGKAVSLPMAKVIDHIRFVEYSLKSGSFGASETRAVEESIAHLRKHLAEHPQPDMPVQAPPEPTVKAPAGPDKRTKEEIMEAVKQRQLKAIADKMAGIDDKKESKAVVMYLPAEIELLNCQFAVKTQDAKRLGSCIEELRRLHVHEAQVMAFSWAHALQTKDEKGASVIVDKARSLGVPPATLASMEAQHKQAFPSMLRQPRLVPVLVAVAVLTALAMAVLLTRKRKSAGAAGSTPA